MVVPSLSTSLCIVSGPGALPLLRNLTNLMSARTHCPRQTCSHLSLQEDKIPMVILYELVDFIKVIRIKVFALYAEVSFDRSAKNCALSAFVLATLSLWCSVG